LLYACVSLVLLQACEGRVNMHGNLPDPDLLADVEVGQAKRRDVEGILGSPSSVALFKGESWYYISEQSETWAFLQPEIKRRKIIVIRFDKEGVVREKKVFGKEKARELSIVERETKTAGSEFSLLRQLFGNVGRFEK
jgi:outer membrane protein assembly factor BamE (lipoprotein component of BamABCDE complex)